MPGRSRLQRRHCATGARGAVGWRTTGPTIAVLAGLGLVACAAPRERTATLTDLGARIAVQIDGEAFAEYRKDSGHRPVIWPLYAPGGLAVTRAFPFGDVAGEPHDHPLQESVWFGHGDVNGTDFWQGDGRIVEIEESTDFAHGEVRGMSSWRLADGREVCRDFHRYGFVAGDDWRAVDVDVTLVASDGDLTLGDNKDGTFAVRLRPELCLRGGSAGGTIRNSEGDLDLACWGKRARWLAYAGEVRGQYLVVAVFDHPHNPGHPTGWHARDYGLLAANPFARQAFANGGGVAGTTTIPAGGQLHLRYRLFVGRGRAQLARLDAAWQAFAAHP